MMWITLVVREFLIQLWDILLLIDSFYHQAETQKGDFLGRLLLDCR